MIQSMCGPRGPGVFVFPFALRGILFRKVVVVHVLAVADEVCKSLA